MATASELIQRCGGYKAVAEHLGLDRTAVLRWTYPGKNGPGDQIPPKHWAAFIEGAKSRGIDISLEELAPADAVVAVAVARKAAA